jgi:hypothetical protein
MSIRVKLTIPTDVLQRLKDLPTRAQQQFRTELRTTVQPAVNENVQRELAVDPGPVVYKFKFSTDKSRRAFFASRGFGKGIPTQRTGSVQESWTVTVSSQLQTDLLSIRNLRPEAKYVYGSATQRQVPGHARTGWGRDFPRKIAVIQEDAQSRVIAAWFRAVKSAMKG